MNNFLFGLLVAVLTLFLVACGSDEGSSSIQADVSEGDSLSGTVVIDGSGTVFPLMAPIAEEFMITAAQNVSVEVSRAGTSAGMKKYVVGETDFANASREIKEEEMKELEANGIDSKEFKVALDGLTLVINPENDWAREMTEEEIKTMFVTGQVKGDDQVLWSDIRPEWPAERVNFYGPNENHGTYEFFVDVIIEKQDLVAGINLQQEYSTLVHLVSEDKHGIAFFGYGYYANNLDRITAVAVDFGSGPVLPSLDTIAEDGEYAPFTRPVFTNINLDAVREKPQVRAFAEYLFREGAAKFAGETGFAPLPEEELQESLEFIQALN
ncbi:phosphate transport system substrate-binding protein [Evansella vedderi]|uniref:Phosphate-binding protein n=1 Tax=Evansella vedderi TaxID=38282 RepID=A0ABT9ZSA2_9BACI|nr:PstS family phosphate ABC transporter substrate-binding protein [Evansella vedderi]MDQ0254099.1 phosphate transport system substrate-binding protein [Evansella vedderi]